MKGRVLVVDDDKGMCDLAEAALRRAGFHTTARQSADAALAVMSSEDFDAVATDLNMKGMNGLELCQRIVANRKNTPVLVITAFGSLDTAVAAIRAGAYDFITKPFEITALTLAVERAVQHRALQDEVTRLRRVVADAQPFDELVGSSPAMQKVYELMDRVAETDASVLITGESGTGKELVARALHERSKRKAGPFVAINCAAMPDTLLESELFGHAKGAFTDAKSQRQGLFLQAAGGTLFLDEVGEMPIGLQPKLLRAIQERKVRPVGGDLEVAFDARLISASNRDLETMVEERRFREDLFYRLNVIHVDLPPLRSRGNDVLLLAQRFIEHYAKLFDKHVQGLSAPAAEKLLSYGWPGNVRELQNAIERAVALTHFSEIAVEDLPDKLQSYRRTQAIVPGDETEEIVSLEEVERRYVLHALEAFGGSRTMTAERLGLDRKTLYRKLKMWGMNDARHEQPAAPPEPRHDGNNGSSSSS
jgi:two-component system response regulator AtoC